MTFATVKVCARCRRPETARRPLVTIPQFLAMTRLETPETSGLPTYCLNRRCVVSAVFDLAMTNLRKRKANA